MAYWVDDNFDTWPETIRAGTAAAGLYTTCGAYCARNTTDGHIPAELAARYGSREWIQKLLDVGLWEAEANGYRDVYYLVTKNGKKLNPTRAEVERKLKLAAERQQRWRENLEKKRKRAIPATPVPRDQRINHVSGDALRDASFDGTPALPPSKEGKGQAPPATPGAARSPDHPATPQAGEDLSPVDWRRQPAFGAPRDPSEAARTTQRAAEARAALPLPRRNSATPTTAFDRLVALDIDPPPPEQEQPA